MPNDLEEIEEIKNHDEFNLIIAYLKNLDVSVFNDFSLKRFGATLSYDEIFSTLESSEKVWVAKSTGKVIGFANLAKPKTDGYSEISYAIFPEFQRIGYGYLFMEKIFNDYKQKNHQTKIKAEAEVTNISSQRILEKLSLTFSPKRVEVNEKYTPNTKIYYWEFGLSI